MLVVFRQPVKDVPINLAWMASLPWAVAADGVAVGGER
jgi:hypothetical protein